MYPIVVIKRTWQGDAYRYARYAEKERTHEVETEVVSVGKELPTLSKEEVERFREHPDKFIKEY